MKRYLLLILSFWLIIFSAFGAITGSGTYASPFTGTITNSSEDRTFSGTVYFDQIEVSGGTLTISPGTTLYAANTTAYILISGTGIINASGTSGSGILFSADNDGDGIAGATETWINISFTDASNTSLIEYSTIENGSGNPLSTAGGGIEIYNANVTVRHCTVRNCRSLELGGGIYVQGSGYNVVLYDLAIYNNTSKIGGAIYSLSSTNLSIDSCRIYNNHTPFPWFPNAGIYGDGEMVITGSSIYNNGGTGVFINSQNTVLRNCLIYGNTLNGVTVGTTGFQNVLGTIINSDLINNGTNLNVADGHTVTVLNSVLWGGTTQYADPGTGATFVNCGVQGGVSGGSGNISLSASNTGSAGPNFIDPSLSNFNITCQSALIDAGISGYNSISAPGADLDGNSRIHTYDIGAYEFQLYYLWTGTSSADWSASGNWSGTPAPSDVTGGYLVVIPNGSPNYPNTSSLTLSSGSRAIVESGASLTVSGATTVNSGCTFDLRSGSAGSANFITGSSVTGSFNVELYLSGSSDPTYNWHYVMTPVDGHSKTALTTGIGNTNNLLNYLESAVSTDKMEGWQWHDGYNLTSGFTELFRNQGYNILLRNLSAQTASFSGNILGGNDFSFSNLTCGTGDTSIHGWHLLGNPFTSGVDVEAFAFTNVEPTIYYTTGNNSAYYKTTTQESLNGGPRYISGLQGFFIHDTIAGGSLTIPATARLYQTTPVLKGARISSDYPILKFNIADGAGLQDEALIYFFADAKSSFDGKYDAYKLLSEDPAYPQIYTIGNNTRFAMNGLPIPDQKTTVPLNVRIGEAKNYTINVLNLENLDDYRVTLLDGDKKIDLKTNPSYTFYAGKGTITNMSIIFENSLTTITEPEKDQTDCWYSNGAVKIKAGVAGFENKSSVLIYDMNGKVIFRRNNLNIGPGEIIEIPVNLSRGIYVTSVINNNKKLVKKIVVTQ
jgi:hypothetical protein